MKCKNCENILLDNDNFCTKCGFLVEKKESVASTKKIINIGSKLINTVSEFLKDNWFKVCILVLIIIFGSLLINKGIKINIHHSSMDVKLRGDINAGIDGAMLYIVN